jgi:hypothetical protein
MMKPDQVITKPFVSLSCLFTSSPQVILSYTDRAFYAYEPHFTEVHG